MIREEFLELLRTDDAFRDEVRREILTEELLALPARFDRLTEVVSEIAESVRDLTAAQQRTQEAQRRTEEALQQLVNWQRGEAGRHRGEQYEKEIVRAAPALFYGGQGGTADQSWIQQRLTKQLKPLLEVITEPEDNPFLADLIWWKGEQIAIVEVSVQVNDYDVWRAARRAEMVRRSGAQALAVVIGREWAAFESQYEAKVQGVEWKVGPDLSDGFVAFRRAPADGN
jgi:hypothetical protein